MGQKPTESPGSKSENPGDHIKPGTEMQKGKQTGILFFWIYYMISIYTLSVCISF